MCYTYDDYPEFYDSVVRKARKAHKCDECGKPIEPGQLYYYGSGKFDGDFYEIKECRRCRFDVHRVVRDELSHGCHWSEAFPPHGELGEALNEHDMERTPIDQVPDWFDMKKVGQEQPVLS